MMNDKEKIDLLTRISSDIAEIKDIDLLLERILTNVRLFYNADAGSIYLKEKDKLKFSYTQNDTLQNRLPEGEKLIYSTFSIPINNKSIAGYVAGNNTFLSIADVYEIDDSAPYSFDSTFDEVSKYKTRSMLTLPIHNHHIEVIGVLQIINSMDSNGDIIPFSDSDTLLIMHFATSAGFAVERAQQ